MRARGQLRLCLTIGAAAAAACVLAGASGGSGSGTIIPSAVASPAIFAPPDVLAGEGDGFVDLVVRLSEPGLSQVSVNYATANSSAESYVVCNYDYINVSGTLIFAPGETTKTVRVDLLDCPNVESLESFTLSLSVPINSTIARARTRVGIVDNDRVAPARLFVRDALVDEQDGIARVAVLLGGPRGQASNSTVTVTYATSAGTATAGADYTANSDTLTFAPGQTVKTIAVPIADDGTPEPAEAFTLSLSGATNATIADGTGSVAIGASDAVPVAQPRIFAPADLVLGEGDGFVDLAVTLSAPGLSQVSVDYATANSSAESYVVCNYDYINVSGTLIFAPGETTKTVRVDLLDCPNVESLESFTLNLSAPINSTIARASGRIGIVDNSTVVETPRLVVRDALLDEKDGSARVAVLLGGPRGHASNSTVTVAYSTSDWLATAGADYTTVSGTLSFAPGQTVKTIAVPITDDGTPEPAEAFTLSLSGATNATIGDGRGSVVIGGSDATAVAQPSISAPPDVVVGEGGGFVDLVVRLSAPGSSQVSVNYATVDSSAQSYVVCNYDYVAASGTLKFAPGEMTKTVRVDILDCPVVEGLESFTLGLSAPVNATIATTSGRVTIVDNSGATPTFADVPPSNVFYDYIEQLFDLGITTGCGINPGGQLLFCPGEPVPRQQMAAFLIRAKGLTQLFSPTPRFADVPQSNPFYGHIERLFEQGITTGCNPPANNLFCPDELVPRQQMAAFLIRAKGLTQLFSPTPTFADVPTSNPFYGHIERLFQAGITTGCGTNGVGALIYCPSDSVLRQQMAAFLIRAFAP